MTNRKITWSKTALKQLEAAVKYIAEDSIQNAGKVKQEVLEKVERLSFHPEIYLPINTKQITMVVTELLNCTDIGLHIVC